ncbi:MAG: hypothetical protein Q7J79_09400, partial [Gemmatimonadales bacterium]|nr:hypothetical protein [Gemmatimonadales bacterium]
MGRVSARALLTGLAGGAALTIVAMAIGIALDPRAAFAQRGHADRAGAFTLADILSAPFPSDMVAAPRGARVAW